MLALARRVKGVLKYERILLLNIKFYEIIVTNEINDEGKGSRKQLIVQASDSIVLQVQRKNDGIKVILSQKRSKT